MAFRQYGQFRILHPKFDIAISESRKTATLNVPFFLLRAGQPLDESDLEGLQDNPVAWAKKIAEKVGDPFYLEAVLEKGEEGWLVSRASLIGFRRFDEFR